MNRFLEDINMNGKNLTIAGIIAMTVMVLTKLFKIPRLADFSLLVGIACFFIVEALDKTPDEESGLRFSTIFSDLKKCSPLFWLILPIVSSLGSILLSKVLFGSQFVDHVLSRVDNILNFENTLMLILRLAIGALGEEIAFRGFFVGKGAGIMGFWPAAILSSAVFALAHLATGSTAIVIYDLTGIFIDAIIYSLAYRYAQNCLVSSISHFLINVVGLIVTFLLFR